MKTNFNQLWRPMTLLGGTLLISNLLVAGQLPPVASLQFLSNQGIAGGTLKIVNSGDQVWVIQTSSDLQNWSGTMTEDS
jgi:hypothetical protein